MNNGECILIAQRLSGIKARAFEIKKIRVEGRGDEALEMQKVLLKEIAEVRESLMPDNVFFRYLEREDVCKRIGKNWDKNFVGLRFSSKKRSYEKFFDKFAKEFEGLGSYYGLDNERYKRFLERLIDNDFEPKMTNGNMMHFHHFDVLNMLNSVFINKFANEDTEIEIEDELPGDMRDNFCCFLERGVVKVNKAGENLGLHMRGGVLMAKETGDHAARFIEGGTFIANEIRGSLAEEMDGGTVCVNKFEGHLADSGRNGTVFVGECGKNFLAGYDHKSGMTVVIGNDLGELGNDSILDMGRVYSYVNRVDGFLTKRQRLDYDFQNLVVYQNMKAMDIDKTIINNKDLDKLHKRGGLAVVRDISRARGELTEGMKRGALVLEDVPEEVGGGMEGGVVIMKWDKSIDEARERVEQKRHGGVVIVMKDNNWDPEKKEYTFL